MVYVESNNVTVFPSANRTAEYQRSARHLSEENIISITNKLTDRDSYVISQDWTSSVFELVLGGYYFKISDLQGLLNSQADFTSATAVYASIEINSVGVPYRTLIGQDEIPEGSTDSLYTGLSISFSDPTLTNGYKLIILERDTTSDAWEVPKENMVKFTPKSLPLVIDGGTI